MIFKRLLTQYQQRPDERFNAQTVCKLNPLLPAQRAQLHELAFNHSDVAIRKAALFRLNNIGLWWKTAETEKSGKLRDTAYQQVEQWLIGEGDEPCSQTQCRRFLFECTNVRFIERMLLALSMQPNPDVHLIETLVSRINKPQLVRQIFFATSDERLQQALLLRFDDIQVLLNVLKKTASADLSAHITERLNQLIHDLPAGHRKQWQWRIDATVVENKLKYAHQTGQVNGIDGLIKQFEQTHQYSGHGANVKRWKQQLINLNEGII